MDLFTETNCLCIRGRICFDYQPSFCSHYSLEYPDAYQTTIPSISGTARQGLASIVFAWFMRGALKSTQPMFGI